MPRPPKAKEPLREAALACFVERGIHASGIREIAKAAGVTEAAVYRHWPSKDDLVLDLYRDHLARTVAILDAAIAGAPDLAGRIRAAVDAAYRLYDEQPLVFRFVLLAQHELAARVDPSWRMPQDAIAGMFGDARGRGEVAGDPALLAAAALGVFLQTATFVVYGRLPGPLSVHADAVTRMILGSVSVR